MGYVACRENAAEAADLKGMDMKHMPLPDWATIEEYQNSLGQPCHRLIGGPLTVEVENARPTDESFFRNEIGTINVTKAWTLVPKGSKPTRIPISEALMDHVAKHVADEGVLRRMSHARMRDPVLMVMAERGFILIDGTHRLKKRIALGKTWVMVFALVPEAIAHCQVRSFTVGPDGTRSEVTRGTMEAFITAPRIGT